MPCLNCPPGLELKEKCDQMVIHPDTINSSCVPCPRGYFASTQDYNPCEHCCLCLEFEIKLLCHYDHNTECENHSCISGYKFDEKLSAC